MQHPYAVLEPEYIDLLRSVKVTRPQSVDAAARYIISNKSRYSAAGLATNVPAAMIGVLHWRESGGNFHTNLANGDSLNWPTTHVPKGRPPLRAVESFPVTWEYAATDAITYDHLNDNTYPWSMPYACYKGEAWNGFGPRNHGIHTGYLWAGTNHYSSGKYAADGVWNADVVDAQIGIVPLLLRIAEIDPSLSITTPYAATVPLKTAPVAQPVPDGVGGNPDHDTQWLQNALNQLGFGPLVEDGSYGRRTSDAVRSFQAAHGLTADGLAGPRTIPAIEASLAHAP